jgi:hypothetical protein
MAVLLCVAYLGVILAAGLWPFQAPRNRVQWLQGRDGLSFEFPGTALTSGSIAAAGLSHETLEIWLNPAATGKNSTILTFDGSAHLGEAFSLHQADRALAIRLNNVDPQGVSRTALFYVDQVFSPGQPVLFSIVLDPGRITVYVNGALARIFSLTAAWNDLSGRIVLASSASTSDGWAGDIYGLAAYRRTLTAAEAAADYASWTSGKGPGLDQDPAISALYRFDERRGSIAHNKVAAGTDFEIPGRYSLLRPHFLLPVWAAFHPAWGYWQDVIINVAGFVPFGILLFAVLEFSRKSGYAAAITIVLGFVTSLLIELVQGLLPTRSSDTTDILTNTLGTALGVLLCRTPIVKRFLTGYLGLRAGERQTV